MKTINLGDWYQSCASMYVWWKLLESTLTFKEFIERAIKENKIGNYTVLWIERDTISQMPMPENCTSCICIMNAWWLEKNENNYLFPPPDWITPVWMSVHIGRPELLEKKEIISYFQQQGAIGCRDITTVEYLKKYGIPSYFTGCLTSALNLRDPRLGFDITDNYSEKVVHVDWLNYDSVLQLSQTSMPPNTPNDLTRLVYAVQRQYNLLHAKEVITTRLHVWFPLLFNNANVVLMNRKTRKIYNTTDYDHWGKADRFNGLIQLRNVTNTERAAFASKLLSDVSTQIRRHVPSPATMSPKAPPQSQ